MKKGLGPFFFVRVFCSSFAENTYTKNSGILGLFIF